MIATLRSPPPRSGNVLVDFSIISGGGRLYFDTDDRSRAQNRQTVGADNNSATIKLIPPSSGVTIVQAVLRGTNQRTSWTFFSNYANVAKVDDVSGRTGVVGTRLSDPFTVEIRDGETGTRVPNQSVEFTLTFSGNNAPGNTVLTSAADPNKTHATTLTLQSGSTG